ncbi:hypothetical protein TcWFU_006833 [Taenia crassiceps]|uniref:Uncharacterized protein n=1 Tax=Taenia crassiceps TaxID=6207 RepID=A0ABR4QM78_9CEST
MIPRHNIIEQSKTSHPRSRSAFPVARRPPLTKKRICERGRSIDAMGKQVSFIKSESAAETLADGGKRSGQDGTEVNQKVPLTHILNPDTGVTEMKKFQRNVIYALNRLIKEAEMENEKKIQQKKEYPFNKKAGITV